MRIWSVVIAVVDGPSRGARAQVGSEIARIGTADGNDLVLADRTVSRFHCEVSVRGNTIVIRDCGSTNGTLIDGVRVREAEIPPGTLVRIGGSALRVELGEEPAFVEVSGRPSFGELVGSSVEMRRVYAILERLALTDATVLVQGETGTGKDVLARSLHAASRRADRPFVAVDCGAIPEHLVESELFGHVKGAFTGATADRRGVFEEADGGTLFLDEIGEMPLALQPKLLRAIESRSIRRVGGTGARTVDVRIIAATNRSLASSINDGSFREDLYYRLAVVPIELPPLRARREDIPALVEHLIGQVCADNDRRPKRVAASAMTLVMQHDWPGNVRELKNVVERLAILTGDAEVITEADVGDALPRVKAVKPEFARGTPFKDLVSAAEREIIMAALEANDHHVSNTARELQLERSHLYKKMRALGIDHRADDEGPG